MKFTVQKYTRTDGPNSDYVEPIDETFVETANVERDSPRQVTIYGTEKDGQLHVIILDQETIDWIKQV